MSAAICMLLAATLLLAAVAKLREPAPFRATLASLVGSRAARALAVAVPAAEALLAALLVAGPAGRPVAVAVLALMLGFAAVLARLERRPPGAALPCNCFGARGDAAPAVGRVRNLLLAAGALVLVARPAGPLWAVSVGELAAAATVAVGLACVWRLATSLVSAPVA